MDTNVPFKVEKKTGNVFSKSIGHFKRFSTGNDQDNYDELPNLKPYKKIFIIRIFQRLTFHGPVVDQT